MISSDRYTCTYVWTKCTHTCRRVSFQTQEIYVTRFILQTADLPLRDTALFQKIFFSCPLLPQFLLQCTLSFAHAYSFETPKCASLVCLSPGTPSSHLQLHEQSFILYTTPLGETQLAPVPACQQHWRSPHDDAFTVLLLPGPFPGGAVFGLSSRARTAIGCDCIGSAYTGWHRRSASEAIDRACRRPRLGGEAWVLKLARLIGAGREVAASTAAARLLNPQAFVRVKQECWVSSVNATDECCPGAAYYIVWLGCRHLACQAVKVEEYVKDTQWVQQCWQQCWQHDFCSYQLGMHM